MISTLTRRPKSRQVKWCYLQGHSLFKDTESGEEAIDSEGVFAECGGDLVLS
jgi:hypothetical protein